MDLTLTLLNPGHWWDRQFSVDEQGLLPMFAAYIVSYIIGCAAYVYLRGDRLLKNAVSALEWLFIVALVLEFLSIFLQTVHGVSYAADGVGLVAVQGLGEMADAASNIAMMAMLVLVAQGLGGVGGLDELPRGWLVNGGVFGAGFLSLFAFDRLGRTMDQRFCYDSDVGAVIVVFRMAAFTFFAVAMARTHARPAAGEELSSGVRSWGLSWRRRLFGLGASAWFLGLPAAYVVAQLRPPWEQVRRGG